jgi:hypothetical protein
MSRRRYCRSRHIGYESSSIAWAPGDVTEGKAFIVRG